MYALRFLEWYCPSSLHEGIEGDLVEQFEEDSLKIGSRKARLNFIINVVKFFRPSIVFRNRLSNSFFQNSMFRNYIKIAFRSLGKAKAHSMINIFGLGLGITCCILISLFVRDEMTFDRFHSKAERIYRVWAKEDWGGANQQFFNTVTPFPMGPTLKDKLPEVEAQVRITFTNTQVKIGEKHFNEQLAVAGRDFFNVFDFKTSYGTTEHALESQNNIVISQRVAIKYFGDADPVNKVVAVQIGEKFEDFMVKAVTHDPPATSSINFDLVTSELNYERLYDDRLTSWFSVFPETYVLLANGVDPATVEKKFPPIFKTALGEDDFKNSKYTAGLQPLTDIHLNPDFPVGNAPVSNPKYSYILAAVAILILIVACINFVTLSIGRSMTRAKEVGIRKVVGALRSQLVAQFVGEAILVTSFALIAGILFAVLIMPAFNDLAGKQLVFSFDQFLIFVITTLLIVIGLISGSYPAFILSSFQPVSILKGVMKGSSRQSLRKVLVGIQLMLSIFLISSTLLMREQLSFLQNKDMGFDKDQLVAVQTVVPRVGRIPERIKAGFEKVEQLRMELIKFPEIISACGSAHDFGTGNWINIGYTDDKSNYRTFYINVIDEKYIRVLQMKLIAGRNFEEGSPSDKRRGVIVNEAFVKELGWADAVGKKIPGKNFGDHEIVGVVKDFNYSPLYTKVKPLVLVEDPTFIFMGSENMNVDARPIPKLMARLKAGAVGTGLERIKEAWKKVSGEEELSFVFVDESMEKQYKSDQNLGKIVTIAAMLAILIASLGLYALASLAMQNHTKEISIRKVMGADDNSLLILLSKEYVFLIAVCLVISVPITW